MTVAPPLRRELGGVGGVEEVGRNGGARGADPYATPAVAEPLVAQVDEEVWVRRALGLQGCLHARPRLV